MELTALGSTSAPIPGTVAAANAWRPRAETYDASASLDLKNGVVLARGDGAPPTGDPIVDAAHVNGETVLRFYHDVLGRNSWDDQGSPIKSLVHVKLYHADAAGNRLDTFTSNMAAWTGTKMIYGDGDGTRYGPFAYALDVLAHEITHGVAQSSVRFEQGGQTGALAESWGDVMGELVQMWKADPTRFDDPAAAQAHRWESGEDVVTPDVPGDAKRSLANPPVAHVRDYRNVPIKREFDMGGVHQNLGIPNKAAYEAGIKIGGAKLANIWYRALTKHLTSTADFSDAARATIRSAQELYSDPSVMQAVRQAWEAVGVSPGHPIELPPLTAS